MLVDTPVLSHTASTQKTTLETLQQFPLLADLPDDVLTRLGRAAIRRTYAAGEMITFEDDTCRSTYFIVQGQVRVYRLSFNGREQVLMRLGPGEVFNTASSLRPDGLNHAYAQAVTTVALCAIPRDDFLNLVSTSPELAMATLRDFAHRIDHLADLVEDLSLHTVRGRLARFLLQHAEAGNVTHRWTQQEIATHVGAVRDMVGRSLRDFASEGLVRMERQRIAVLDRAALETEAEN